MAGHEVALLAEGVDRNSAMWSMAAIGGVALLAEGVDRNNKPKDKTYRKNRSPSSRRAWIEISRCLSRTYSM